MTRGATRWLDLAPPDCQQSEDDESSREQELDSPTLLFRRRSFHSLDRSGIAASACFRLVFAKPGSGIMRYADQTTKTETRHVTQ
jgi:hypothetical protein